MTGNTAAGTGGGSSKDKDSKDKETNIKVVVRCRGRNEREVRDCFPTVVQPQGPHNLVVRPSLTDTNISRSYAFDSVYGPEASQQHIFHDVIKPMLEEVQQGYNCSVFCYGQTGTGKTYTMEGDLESAEFAPNTNAGIIPRALHHIFSVLESNTIEFSVRVSYLELYNEELKDLLSPLEDDQRKLRIFEDGRKGNFVQGLEERLINNVVDGITALKKGSLKRQTAATKCNENSSRSHTIFSITVHMKEATPDSEDLLSIGKLNFVDLAGSENVGRSGAENRRAREAGMINQSLLVLGRVINALVEKSPHVPYRESKLTRLLQDSLGGRTKTTMIATVGPAKCSMDETLSTLDYANRAKSIRNKPEVNQRMKKNALIREYVAEIDRLNAELKFARDKNGVHLAVEAYQAMMDENRSLKDRVKEMQQQGQLMADQAREREDHLRRQLRTQELLRRAHSSTESRLDALAKGLVMTLDESMADVTGLHAKLERQKVVDRSNLEAHDAFRKDLLVTAAELECSVEKFLVEHEDITSGLARDAQSRLSHMAEVVEAISRQHVERSLEEFSRRIEMAKGVIRKRHRLSGERDSEIKAMCDKFDKYLKEQQKDFQRVHALAVQQLEESFIAHGTMLGNSINEISAKQEKIRREVTHHMSAQTKAIEGLTERVRLDAVEGVGRVNEVTQHLEDFVELERRQAEDERQNLKKRVESLLTEFSESQSRRLDSCVAAVTGRSRECGRTIEASAQQFAGLSQEALGRLNESSQNIAATIKDAEQDVVDTKLRITESSRQIDHDVQNFSDVAARSFAGMGSSATGICQSVSEIVSQSETSNVDAEAEHLAIMDELVVVMRDESETLSSSLHSVGSDATTFEDTVADSLAKDVRATDQFRSTATDHVAKIRSKTDLREFLRRDTSTGSTPRRKEYRYPRSWRLTSVAGPVLALAGESGGKNPPPDLDEGGSVIEYTIVREDNNGDAGGIMSTMEKGEPALHGITFTTEKEGEAALCRNRRKRPYDEGVGVRKRLRPARAEDKENNDMDDEEVAGDPVEGCANVEVPAEKAETSAATPRRRAKPLRSPSNLPRKPRIPTQQGRRGGRKK